MYNTVLAAYRTVQNRFWLETARVPACIHGTRVKGHGKYGHEARDVGR